MKKHLLTILAMFAVTLASACVFTGCKSDEQKAAEAIAKEMIEARKAEKKRQEDAEKTRAWWNENVVPKINEAAEIMRSGGSSFEANNYVNSIKNVTQIYISNDLFACQNQVVGASSPFAIISEGYNPGTTGFESCEALMIAINTHALKELDRAKESINPKTKQPWLTDEEHKKSVDYINNTMIPLFKNKKR